MAMSSSNLTFISLFNSTDIQGKMVLASHSYTDILSYLLIPAQAVSCPMISTEKCYYSHLSGDQIDKVFTVSARDKNSWPRLPHHTQRWGYLSGGQKFILWVNRVLGRNCVYDTNKPKKSKGEKNLKKKTTFDFQHSLISSPSLLLLWPIALQLFWRRMLTCRR